MKQWKSPQSCNSDEVINNIAYNNETLALIIENETSNKKRIELRSLSTFDPLWSTSFNAAYHFTPWNNRVCVLKYNEWLAIDYGNSRLFHVSKDGQIATNGSTTTYAVNDVFAPTDLYFYLMNTDISSLDTNHIINLNMIYEQPIQNLPKYFVLSDSHGKYFPPYHRTAQYQLVIKSISGLQWNNPWQQELSVNNLIESTSIKSIISTCAGIIFMVGTNSIRSWSASEIIQDIVNITQSIRSTYDHLNRKTDISICTIFPCLKTSTRFLTSNLLTSNIND
ncbi:unnamed protein product [Rotaria magnacalcarata]|uniref:Uncharacterized protein n=1 Tax=Rotaria magnacalcarata TaxID=392030 RepID=A0A816FGK5_9BILA|nr:unnamed protein product [Rotaria magnacalcarata]